MKPRFGRVKVNEEAKVENGTTRMRACLSVCFVGGYTCYALRPIFFRRFFNGTFGGVLNGQLKSIDILSLCGFDDGIFFVECIWNLGEKKKIKVLAGFKIGFWMSRVLFSLFSEDILIQFYAVYYLLERTFFLVGPCQIF